MEPIHLESTVPDLAAGRLLVALPTLQDPNFVRTVVLLLDVDDDGVLGVVLNRPTRTEVGEVLESWGGVVASPDVLFNGGPVGLDSALGVGELAVATPQDGLLGWRPLTGQLGLLDLDTPPDMVNGALSSLRIYAGYAGWGAGQLEEEIDQGAWAVIAAAPSDTFTTDPEQLRSSVLRRQPSPLNWLANAPLDPDAN